MIISLAVTVLIILLTLLLLSNNTSLLNIVDQLKNDRQSTSGNPATKCRIVSDCVIKELQDCGGTYRTCVNKNYEQNWELLKNSCAGSEKEDQGPGLARPLWIGPEFVGCDCNKFECTNVFSYK